jgi:predicted RNase H-like nuclease (RuvC/YqgF family)
MAKIFLWLSAALLLGSVLLGWLNVNKGNARQEKLQLATAEVQTVRGQAEKNRKELATSKAQSEAASQAAAELRTQLAAAAQESARLKTDADTNAGKIAAAQAEIAELKSKLATIDPGRPVLPPTDETQLKIKELETRLAEYDTVKKTLEDQLKTADTSMRQLQRAEQQRQMRVMRSGLSGSVLAVDRNWNFVVLDLGDRNGVVNHAEMVVTRGGGMIGKVRITSVEPSQSIADIVPNSTPPGLSIQRGDRVIYAGGSEEPTGSTAQRR